MIKTTHSSQANQNFHESITRVLKMINRRLKRNAIPLGLSALAAVSLAQSGCSSSFRGIASELNNNLLVEYRDAIWSRRAYNLRFGNCDRQYSDHYRDGFLAGYTDISNGGDGYVPALPPTEYRGFEYQSAEGAKCVNTWFEGYPAGVAAANQDKTGDYKDMFISKMIDSAVTQANAKHSLPGDVPIIKPNAETNASGSNRKAPPAPTVAQAYEPTVTGENEVALTDAALANEQAYAKALSVVESASYNTSAEDQVRPALPPIVKGHSRQPQVIAPRPSEGSLQPLPVARQATTSVILNQLTR